VAFSPKQNGIDAIEQQRRHNRNHEEKESPAPTFVSQCVEQAGKGKLKPEHGHQCAEFQQIVGLGAAQMLH
ncbi:MAG: hypothetical protein KDI35_15355, partial [Gammaproteobacteria bacterium]|nr:hypothetical protein [Gammaproteobacteria bacterium]